MATHSNQLGAFSEPLAYQYSMGTWIPLDALRHPPCDGLADSQWLLLSGFDPKSILILGNEHGLGIEIYSNEDETAFFAYVSLFGFSCKMVYIDDFPSIMMFIKDFSAGFDAQEVKEQIDEIKDGLRKLFHAYHGHEMGGICSQCDPIAVRSREMARKNSPKHARHE